MPTLILAAFESWLPQVYAQQQLQDTDHDEHKLQVADADEFVFRRGYDGVVVPLHVRAWHELVSDLCQEKWTKGKEASY